MSKLNLLINLNGYQDANPTINPSQNNFRWSRDIQGINIGQPNSQSLQLPAGQSVTLASGAVSTSADNTTTYNISLKAGTGNTYKILASAGTSPAFRASRVSGADASTAVSVSKNASLMIITSVAGTPLSLISGAVVVGDEVRLGSAFSAANQGKYKILSRTTTSLTVEHESSVIEASVVLGASFNEQLSIFSANGVQVGDQVDLLAGFSSVSFGTYEITDVSPNYIEIYSAQVLPVEAGISNSPSAILIYRDAKSLLYVESDKALEITIDNSLTPNKLFPTSVGTSVAAGVFLSIGSIKSVVIKNTSQETATIFFVTAE